MTQELATKNETQMATTPDSLLALAVQQGADLDKLEKLMQLKERWEASEAKKAYITAMNAFKADPPVITKSKHVSFENKTGGKTEYSHALLDDAAEILGAALTKHGLSFMWECEQLDGGVVRVTCVMTHALGHSERVSLQAGLDQSGGKNNIQALGSSVSYLERYTLFAATGIAPKGIDDDGKSAAAELITADQVQAMEKKIKAVGADKDKFLQHLKINALDELRASSYDTAMNLLDAKAKQAKKEGK